MKKKILLLSMACVFVFFGQAAISAPLIYIDLDGNSLTAETNWSVNLGDTFSADIYASDFTDTMGSGHMGLIGFGLDATYDPSIVTVNSADAAMPWTPLLVSLGTPGIVSMGGLYLAIPPSLGLSTDTPLLLGTISFSSIAEGTMGLALADRMVIENVALDGFVFDQLIEFRGAQITANAVPIPTTGLLLGSALAVLIGLPASRKRRIV